MNDTQSVKRRRVAKEPVKRSTVWSYGGGKQSVAIAVLIVQGRLPRPDYAVIADTGREVQSTWDYLRDHAQPYLDQVGLKIQIAPHTLAKWDLHSSKGKLLIPAFTKASKLDTFCSGEWKREVVMRWCRLQGIKQCDNWIGYSLDEIGRVTKPRKKWFRQTYPLLHMVEPALRLRDCIELIEQAGLPVPRKSRCGICPNQTAREWAEHTPEQLAEIQRLYDELSAKDQQGGPVWASKQRMPLPLINFQAVVDNDEGNLFECRGESCWT